MIERINRANRFLAVALVVQLVLIAAVFWPRPSLSQASDKPLFEGIQSDQVAGFTIGDMDENEIQIAQKDDQWVLPHSADYPVKQQQATDFANTLASLKANRLVSQTEASQKRLKVAPDDYNRLIEFELEDGKKYRLYLGTSPSYSVSHVRVEGQDEVYLVSDLSISTASTSVTSWIDTQYFKVPSDQITALTLENENGKFEFTKDEEGVWTYSGLGPDETLDQNKIKSLVTGVATVYLNRPLGQEEKPEYGLSDPSALVTMLATDADGKETSYALKVGAKDPEDNTYVVSSSESPYFVRVPEYEAKDLVGYGHQDFLQLPPTPTPKATAEAE